MTRILIFGKAECAKCKTTKHKLDHYVSGLGACEVDHKVELVFHDMETLDGRAEGAFYDVNPGRIPLTVMEKDVRQAARWDGEVPDIPQCVSKTEIERFYNTAFLGRRNEWCFSRSRRGFRRRAGFDADLDHSRRYAGGPRNRLVSEARLLKKPAKIGPNCNGSRTEKNTR